MFQVANQVNEGKREGNELTKHKPATEAANMEKFNSSGNLSNKHPISLQSKAFSEVALHFGRRGRDVLGDLKNNTVLKIHFSQMKKSMYRNEKCNEKCEVKQ